MIISILPEGTFVFCPEIQMKHLPCFLQKGSILCSHQVRQGGSPIAARLSVARKIFGEWTSIGNPCRGTDDQNKITFGSQSTQILAVHGKKNAFIYMGDRWKPEDLADSRHVWLPVEWENGNPVIKWYPNWNLSKLK